MAVRTNKIRIALIIKIFILLSVTLAFFVLNIVNGKEEIFVERQSGVRHLLQQQIADPDDGNCTPAAIHEFPSDGFSRDERQQGWILVHVALACYCFILLAVVCDDYFVPAVKQFSERLNLREDITGATFMATASSSAELFINCIGTFVTEGDLGVGTIVGSAVFNILAVPACCGLFSNDMTIELDWWAISRDSLIYGVSVVLLITVLHDGRIYTYEALTLVLIYVLYIIFMCFNSRFNSAANKVVSRCRKKRHYSEIMCEVYPLLLKSDSKCNGVQAILMESEVTLKDLDESRGVWHWPEGRSFGLCCWWLFTWPISFLLSLSIPDCNKHPKWFCITFMMCVLWIGGTSYMVAWLITCIGDTLNIPDSVMGLTFLAAGTSVPEAVSSVLVANQGLGGMGISSSLGSNTFDILLCLGIPWLIKSSLYPKVHGKHYIKINSHGLNYSAISLLSTLLLFYLCVAWNKFRINWKVAVLYLAIYATYLVFASLLELNVFFPVNLPTCLH